MDGGSAYDDTNCGQYGNKVHLRSRLAGGLHKKEWKQKNQNEKPAVDNYMVN